MRDSAQRQFKLFFELVFSLTWDIFFKWGIEWKAIKICVVIYYFRCRPYSKINEG